MRNRPPYLGRQRRRHSRPWHERRLDRVPLVNGPAWTTFHMGQPPDLTAPDATTRPGRGHALTARSLSPDGGTRSTETAGLDATRRLGGAARLSPSLASSTCGRTLFASPPATRRSIA